MNCCLTHPHTHTDTYIHTYINMMCYSSSHTQMHTQGRARHLCGLFGLLIQTSLVLISLLLKCFPFYIL